MPLDYEHDLYIDESSLDVEWLDQPRLMMRYSRELANAEREVSKKKEKLAVVMAELDRDIRSDPAEFGITVKVTEAISTNTTILQKEYKEAMTELINAKYEERMLKGAVESIQHRKEALQDLVRLHGQQYFAGPKIPRDLPYEVEQKQRKKLSNETVKITRRKS